MPIAANPNVPHINNPVADTSALVMVTQRLKEGLESLGGHRGSPYDRAVTVQDLIVLGLITKAQADQALSQ